MKNPCLDCKRKNKSKKHGKCITCKRPGAYADLIYDDTYGLQTFNLSKFSLPIINEHPVDSLRRTMYQ
jgi:hypothetical protein